jgi:hypothetical protein
LGRFW